MTANGTPGQAPRRQRGTTAVVLSRPAALDAPPAAAAARELAVEHAAAGAGWTTIVTWVLLGAAVGAAWALLLLGDSLVAR
jgi:hypothetical protein